MRIAHAALLLACLLPIAAWAQQGLAGRSLAQHRRRHRQAEGGDRDPGHRQRHAHGADRAGAGHQGWPEPAVHGLRGQAPQPAHGRHDHRLGLKAQGKAWGGGRILDPENGKEYSVKMTPVAAGRKLEVRGFIGMALLGRTQVWVRE